jgi:hypothetical protein
MAKKFDEFEVFRLAEATTVDGLNRLRELLETGVVDPNVKDPDRGMTPLHYAANRGNLEAIEILIDNGADVNAQNKRGRTPLHTLVEQKYDKVVLWLVQYCGANPHIADVRNIAPMDLALNWFQKEIIDAFEARGKFDEGAEEEGQEEYAEEYDEEEYAGDDTAQAGASGASTQEVFKIYLPNGSYKSIRVGPFDTAESVCETLADKLDLPKSYGNKYFTMWEKIKDRERKMGPGEELFGARKNWPLIFGETGNETTKHCHFFVAVAMSAPEKVRQLTGTK